MRLVLVTHPAAEPLTATEAKSRLGIGSEVPDATVDAFIKAARQTLDGWDGWLGRALISQQWKMLLDRFPSEAIDIPLPPTIKVDEVAYFDESDTSRTVAEANYRTLLGEPTQLLTNGSYVWPQTQCRPDAVQITFTAGYGTAGSDVPEPIRSAIALMVSHLRSMSARNLFVSQDSVEGVGSKSYVVGGNAGAAIDAAVTSLLSTYRVFA